MKHIFITLITVCLTLQIGSQAASPDYYGDWKLISMRIDEVEVTISGSFTSRYDYEGIEETSNGSIKVGDKIISANCITKYQMSDKRKNRFVQTVTSVQGAECGDSVVGDTLLVNYQVTGNRMTQKAFIKNVQVVMNYIRE